MASLLVATVFAGLLLLAVTLWIARGIEWRSNDLMVDRGDGDTLGALASSPAVWVIVFLALALGTTGIAVFAVGGFGVTAPGVSTLAMAALGLLVLLYLVGGTYVAARGRKISSAGATLTVTIVLGALLIAAIAGKLLVG